MVGCESEQGVCWWSWLYLWLYTATGLDLGLGLQIFPQVTLWQGVGHMWCMWCHICIYIYSQFLFLCCPTTITFMQTRSSSRSPPASANNSSPSKSKVQWTNLEEAVLIDFLFHNKDEMTNGSTFKAPVFQKVAKHIQPLHVKGGWKGRLSCKTKWKNVCISFVWTHHKHLKACNNNNNTWQQQQQCECDTGTSFPILFSSSYFSPPFMCRRTWWHCPSWQQPGPVWQQQHPQPGASASTIKHAHHPHMRSMQPHNPYTVTIHTSLCHDKVHCPSSFILIITFTTPHTAPAWWGHGP